MLCITLSLKHSIFVFKANFQAIFLYISNLFPLDEKSPVFADMSLKVNSVRSSAVNEQPFTLLGFKLHYST